MGTDDTQAADVSVSPGRPNNSGSRSARRDRYADVGAAARASFGAALAADPQLTPTTWAVLAVIHQELTTYSRLSSSFSHSLIASRAGLDRRHLRRVLQRLHDVGAIHYTPGDGRRLSVISLPVDVPPERANGMSPQSARLGRAENGRSGARAQDVPPERANGMSPQSARLGRADITRSSSEESFREELNHCDDDAVAPASNTKTQRPRDELFDAMVEVVGWDIHQLTKGARGKINAALKDLRAVGATATEIRVRAQRYQRINPDLNLTPNALSAWWPALSETAKSAEVSPSSRYRDASVVLAEAEAEGL